MLDMGAGAAGGQEMYTPVALFGPGMEGHVIKCMHGTVCATGRAKLEQLAWQVSNIW